MSAKIESLKIKLGDTEAEMTLDEARSLKLALDEIFPETKDRLVPQPYPVPTWPRPWRYEGPVWTSGGSTTTGKYNSGTVSLDVSS